MGAIKNRQSGERLSFYKLFKEKKYRVLIPIIQRDYAQGRKNQSEVRETFLSALYQYLEENKPNRDLDFVYGSLNTVENQTDFIPLDGQQRLTTLFLLHWYLHQIQEDKKSEVCQDFKESLLKDDKSMFTYETRTSSTDFCNALMHNNVDFKNLIDINDKDGITKDNQLSKTIENSAWYFLSWKQDPTIQSMLVMIDAIHNKFSGKKEFFYRLLDIENPIITFQFLNLEDYKLTDDLYIKMNSRGKPLTSFENFKAKFEQYLENIELAKNETFQLIFNGTKQNVSLNKYFSYNIDTKWANLFWAYRELVGDKNVYDEEMKNFIRVIFTSQYATSVQISKSGNVGNTYEIFDFLLGTPSARKRVDYTDDISFYKYDEVKALSEDGILFLINALDNLVNGNDKLKKYISPEFKFYFDEEESFENALKYTFENNQERIMFHAYVRFLIVNNDDRSGIDQWMRVIHNLASNTIYNSSVDIARAIKSVEKMLPNSNNILYYIINNDIDGFASWQILEEKIKAILILKSTENDWKTIILNTEKHIYFKGQIGFVLAFSDILEYYKTKNNCDWVDDDDYFERFVNYSRKAVATFEFRNSEAYSQRNFYTCDFLLERAVMTKGICAVKSLQNSLTTKNRLNLLHTNVIGNNIARDYSWKRLLRIDGTHATEMNFLKELFDDNRLNIDNIEHSLNLFLSDRTNCWRDYFIKSPFLMRGCSKGFIKKDNDNEIYLLASIYQGANQYFAEMYTFYLWKMYIENNDFNGFFTKKEYIWSKSHGDNPYISLNFSYAKKDYEIHITWDSKREENGGYVFRLKKSDKSDSGYSQEIQSLLTNTLIFDWDSETKEYTIFITDIDKVKKEIEEISNILK